MSVRWTSATIAFLAAASAALFGGCFPGGPRFSPDPQPALSAEEAELGALPVFITDQTTDGRLAKIRGKVLNPYHDSIEGVRMIYRDVASGSDLRVLNQFQKVIEQPIDAGNSRLFRWDIESMYMGSAGARFHIMAFAIKRKGQTMPLPPGWRADLD